MGSGTTAVVCEKLNRNFVGSEIHKEYVELSYSRLVKQTESKNKHRQFFE
jgi:DNA modification methylase